jgi:hypothetical protein
MVALTHATKIPAQTLWTCVSQVLRPVTGASTSNHSTVPEVGGRRLTMRSVLNASSQTRLDRDRDLPRAGNDSRDCSRFSGYRARRDNPLRTDAGRRDRVASGAAIEHWLATNAKPLCEASEQRNGEDAHRRHTRVNAQGLTSGTSSATPTAAPALPLECRGPHPRRIP